MALSLMGTVARSEIIMATTSSDGWSSPICLLPIILKAITTRAYKIIVRRTDISKIITTLQYNEQNIYILCLYKFNFMW